MPLSYKQLGNTFISTPSVTIYTSGTQYFISASSTGSGTIISGINIGTNANSISFFSGLTNITDPNDTLVFRNLLAGTNINIALSTSNDGDILISRGSPTLVNQISNIGGGSNVLSAISISNILFARTISGTSGLVSSNPASPTILLFRTTNTTASRLYISNATSQLTTDTNFQINTTTGSLGIGSLGVSTTSRLLIAAGTGAISHFRLTPFASTIISPIDGDIWYSTSGNTLKFYKNNISTDFIFKDNNISLTGITNSILQVNTAGTISQRYINSLGVFNALSSVTISNTASETSIISSNLIGSNTLLASTSEYNSQLGIGRKFRFNARGTIDTVDNVNLNIRVKLGSTVISSSSTISVGSFDPYSSEIEIDATFTIRNSGLVVCSGKIMFLTFPPSTIGGDPVIFGLYSQDATIDTTSDKLFDCTAQFDIADPTNIITITESTLEILN
jgi:hypothetical protein